MQMGFYFDQTRCTGCDVCVVACKDWNDVPAGPASWRRVTSIEEGNFPDLFVAFLATSCYHCTEPACVTACPSQAITKRKEDGIVVVDREKCWGRDRCDLCWESCPYQSPQFGSEPNARMQKCNFCLDRLEVGKQPVCVAGCPMRALDAGSLEELKKKKRYGQEREAEGFICSSKTKPSIIFKPKVRVAFPETGLPEEGLKIPFGPR